MQAATGAAAGVAAGTAAAAYLLKVLLVPDQRQEAFALPASLDTSEQDQTQTFSYKMSWREIQNHFHSRMT